MQFNPQLHLLLAGSPQVPSPAPLGFTASSAKDIFPDEVAKVFNS